MTPTPTPSQLTEDGFTCQCKLDHMGVTCAEARNPCASNYHSEYPNGVDGCGSHGVCVPTLGSNVYSCDCYQGYQGR